VGNLLPGSGLIWHLFKKVEIYLHAKFRWDTSIHGLDKTTSGFGKRTAAILEFYFRFCFQSMYNHRHTILHLPAKFRSNRTIRGGVMTSYWIFKMAAIESEIYFRVEIYWRHRFNKVDIYLHAKSRWDISIHGWDITTSVFEKQTAAILPILLLIYVLYSHRHTILHLPAKFRRNQMIVGGVMTSYPFFSRWRPAAILELMWVMLEPTKCNSRSQLGPQIWSWSDL